MSFKTYCDELLDLPLRDFVTRKDIHEITGISEPTISAWQTDQLSRYVIVGKKFYLYLRKDVDDLERYASSQEVRKYRKLSKN